MDDNEIIQKAFEENWILITNDKDFGDQIYREREPHHGVVLLRLDDERAKKNCRIEKITGLILESSPKPICCSH